MAFKFSELPWNNFAVNWVSGLLENYSQARGAGAGENAGERASGEGFLKRLSVFFWVQALHLMLFHSQTRSASRAYPVSPVGIPQPRNCCKCPTERTGTGEGWKARRRMCKRPVGAGGVEKEEGGQGAPNVSELKRRLREGGPCNSAVRRFWGLEDARAAGTRP